MSYDFFYSYDSGEMLGLILFYVLYMIAVCGFSIAMYIFRSMGMYAIATRRGLKHAWFAWVPVVDQYLLGCVSDQYQYVVKGKVKSRRKWLLGLNIVMAVLILAFVLSVIGMIFNVAGAAMNGLGNHHIAGKAMDAALGILGLSLPLTGVAIGAAVIRYMAMYDLYASCDPKNSTMYLVLSILFGVTEPFFLFFNRNKDEGMPPRREPEQPVWEAPREEEPWVEETE